MRILSGALVPALLLAGAAAAAPSNDTPVLKSGRTFHRAVCAPVVGRAARCHAHVVTDATGKILAQPKELLLGLGLAPAGYGPGDLRDAYKIGAAGNPSTIVAVVDAYGYANAEADLATYRAQYGLPACTTANGCFKKLNQNGQQGSYPRDDTGWAQESALDLDMVSAMCPACKIYLIEANSNSFANLARAENTAARLRAHAISNSYGGSESGSQTYESAYNHSGIAITVSTGDDGYGVEFPSSSPHVTAVGGTSLSRAANARGWNESVWSGAGSGCSALYAKQSWQTDLGCARRTLADVSAVADPNTGVAVYGPTSAKRSAWLVFGGTSVAAALIAGIYGANGGSATYGSDPYANTIALFDVASGSNGKCVGSYLCTGKPGYDGPSGLGTPNGSGAF